MLKYWSPAVTRITVVQSALLELSPKDELNGGTKALPIYAKVCIHGTFALEVMGPLSSTGSPITFMMRPKVSCPTGTMIGAPVSVHPCFNAEKTSHGMREVHQDS